MENVKMVLILRARLSFLHLPPRYAVPPSDSPVAGSTFQCVPTSHLSPCPQLSQYPPPAFSPSLIFSGGLPHLDPQHPPVATAGGSVRSFVRSFVRLFLHREGEATERSLPPLGIPLPPGSRMRKRMQKNEKEGKRRGCVG